MFNVVSPSTLQYAILPYLPADNLGPQGIYLQQIDRVTLYLGSLVRWVETPKRPKRALIVGASVQMDDGRTTHSEDCHVQYNTSHSPGKGGVRFRQDVTLSKMMALSAWTSVKNAAVNVLYGGARGGIRVDSRRLSSDKLECLTRHYTGEIGIIIDPNRDISAPNVNTNMRIVA